MRLMVVSTVCLCLLILVLGAVYGVIIGKITSDALGSLKIKGFAYATGFAGLGLLLLMVIRRALPSGPSGGQQDA
jgi:hypothetical protein